MKRCLLLIAVFFISLSSVAQSLNESVGHYEIGNSFYLAQQYDSALLHFNKALIELNEDKLGLSLSSGIIRESIADTYCRQSQFLLAVNYGMKALGVYKNVLGDGSERYANCARKISGYYEKAGLFDKAIAPCKLSTIVYRDLYGTNSEAFILSVSKMGELYLLTGDYSSSKQCYLVAVTFGETVFGKSSIEYSGFLHGLTLSYYRMGQKLYTDGNYIEAINAFMEAKEGMRDNNDSIYYIDCIARISDCYWLLGNYDRAIDCGFERVISAKTSCGDNSVEHAEALTSLAYYFIQRNYYDLAEEIILLANDVFQMNEVESQSLARCIELLRVSKKRDRSELVESCLSALNNYVEVYGKEGRQYAALLNELSVAYFKNGDNTNAIAYGKECMEKQLLILGEEHPDYIISLRNLAEYYLADGDCEEALTLYKSFYSYESKRLLLVFSEMTATERSYYWRMVNSDFRRMVDMKDCVIEDDELNLMVYNSLLSIKGILLKSDMALRNIINTNNDSVTKGNYILLNQIRSQVSLNTKEQFSDYQYASLFNECNELERLIMRSVRDRYINYLDSVNITFKDIQNALSERDVVIEFCQSASGNNYYAVMARKAFPFPVIIDLKHNKAADSIWLLGHRSYNDSDVGYNTIWNQIEPFLEEGDNVYYSPDGLLHQLNIDVLCDSKGKMACEKYHLYRVSSTRQICESQQTVDYSSVALFGGLVYDMDTTEMLACSSIGQDETLLSSRGVAGDSTTRIGWKYLSGTKEEVESIMHLFQEQGVQTCLFTNKEGTEEAFKSLSGQHIPIIHIATHGFFFNNDKANEKVYFQAFDWSRKNLPDNSLQRSGLIMAGGQNAWLGGNIPANVEDGILLSEEIASMDLSGTDLVVLSACETGLGDITSDGVFGLQRAFKMAGVQTLVMSLWKVDDNATSFMMQTFYEHLLSGMSKREAFSLAQTAVRAKYPEPYYWAGFIMLD